MTGKKQQFIPDELIFQFSAVIYPDENEDNNYENLNASQNTGETDATAGKKWADISPSAVAAQLCHPQMLTGAPLMVIYKKRFRRYATSRGRMAFKANYPICSHNFGRTRPVARF